MRRKRDDGEELKQQQADESRKQSSVGDSGQGKGNTAHCSVIKETAVSSHKVGCDNVRARVKKRTMLLFNQVCMTMGEFTVHSIPLHPSLSPCPSSAWTSLVHLQQFEQSSNICAAGFANIVHPDTAVVSQAQLALFPCFHSASEAFPSSEKLVILVLTGCFFPLFK